jgi:hypothetical protein
LKAGSSTSDHNQRITAAKNVAYYVDHLLNGGGFGVPDPFGKIADSPPAGIVLPPNTPLVAGGDWNEDEATNGTAGPADWLTKAQTGDASQGTDGTDRNRTDMTYDAAADIFTGATSTGFSSKYDYVAWQDSLMAIRRQFVFNSATITPSAAVPVELLGFPGGAAGVSATASDHRPVVVDLVLPSPLTCNTAASDLGYPKSGANLIFPRFSACGSLASSGSADLTLSEVPPAATIYVLGSPAEGLEVFLGATIVPEAYSLIGPFTASAAGTFTAVVPGGGGPYAIFLQWAILDAGAAFGFSMSNALRLSFLP